MCLPAGRQGMRNLIKIDRGMRPWLHPDCRLPKDIPPVLHGPAYGVYPVTDMGVTSFSSLPWSMSSAISNS